MDRRIFGLENEYGVTCTFRGSRKLSPDEVARYLFRRVVSWGRSSNVFLRNGARLYLDVGSHPEYATPECDSIPDLVVHDKAGERILEGLLVDADRRLREEGIAGDIYLFKNNTDSAGNSYGCHENYLVGRHGEFGRLADILIPFLVTRQVICGAGKVLQTPRGAVYCVSQRAAGGLEYLPGTADDLPGDQERDQDVGQAAELAMAPDQVVLVTAVGVARGVGVVLEQVDVAGDALFPQPPVGVDQQAFQDPFPGLVVNHQVGDAVAFRGRVLGMAAHVEVEPGPVAQEHVAAAAPRDHAPEQVPGHFVRRELSAAPERARDPVLVLQPEYPSVHRGIS